MDPLLANIALSEEYVPGAGLGYWPDGKKRKPNDLCVPVLKRWLAWPVRDVPKRSPSLSQGKP